MITTSPVSLSPPVPKVAGRTPPQERVELDQLDQALRSDDPAAGTAFGWRRVRELVRDEVPAAVPITALVRELFG